MAKTLKIKNIDKSVSNEQLTKKIRQYGRVRSVRIQTDNVTFQSIGVADVEMESAEEVEKVITSLNGEMFQGKEIIAQRS